LECTNRDTQHWAGRLSRHSRILLSGSAEISRKTWLSCAALLGSTSNVFGDQMSHPFEGSSAFHPTGSHGHATAPGSKLLWWTVRHCIICWSHEEKLLKIRRLEEVEMLMEAGIGRRR
jgi:hypothetical protein